VCYFFLFILLFFLNKMMLIYGFWRMMSFRYFCFKIKICLKSRQPYKHVLTLEILSLQTSFLSRVGTPPSETMSFIRRIHTERCGKCYHLFVWNQTFQCLIRWYETLVIFVNQNFDTQQIHVVLVVSRGKKQEIFVLSSQKICIFWCFVRPVRI
jgi:hypothetical protein